MTLDDTWFPSDLPVLEAAAVLLDEQQEPVALADVAARAKLPVDETSRSLVRLEGEYVEMKWVQRTSGGKYGRVTSIRPAARRAVGQWPSPEGLADRILTELDDRVDAASTEAERSRWVKMRDGVASAGRDVLVDVVGAAVSRSMGGL